jgi:predicted HD superfamily hydrolase involved in NAD metabolism
MDYTNNIYNFLDGASKDHIKSLKQLLAKKMPQELYLHSLGTFEYSAMLAARYISTFEEEECAKGSVNKDSLKHRMGLKFYKLLVASLIHDYAKIYDEETLAGIATDKSLGLTEFESSCGPILHGYVGPLIIKRELGIDDIEIGNSIRSHTTGSLKMNILDRIVYISDKLEPSRNYRGVVKLRKISRESLDLCLLEVYKSNIIYIIMRNHTLHPDTSKIWNYICGGLKNAI